MNVQETYKWSSRNHTSGSRRPFWASRQNTRERLEASNDFTAISQSHFFYLRHPLLFFKTILSMTLSQYRTLYSLSHSLHFHLTFRYSANKCRYLVLVFSFHSIIGTQLFLLWSHPQVGISFPLMLPRLTLERCAPWIIISPQIAIRACKINSIWWWNKLSISMRKIS